MVGNDVVDLGDPETFEANLHSRFDERVFSVQELDLLQAASNRHELRWILWAAKESAYKLAKRDDPTVVFAHRAFDVVLAGGAWGTVKHHGRSTSVQVRHLGDAVHVVCAHNRSDHQHVQAEVSLVPPGETPSDGVRTLARRRLCTALGVEPQHVAITKRAGRIPECLVRGEAADISLSLSHHGRFIAFACRSS